MGSPSTYLLAKYVSDTCYIFPDTVLTTNRYCRQRWMRHQKSIFWVRTQPDIYDSQNPVWPMLGTRWLDNAGSDVQHTPTGMAKWTFFRPAADLYILILCWIYNVEDRLLIRNTDKLGKENGPYQIFSYANFGFICLGEVFGRTPHVVRAFNSRIKRTSHPNPNQSEYWRDTQLQGPGHFYCIFFRLSGL